MIFLLDFKSLYHKIYYEPMRLFLTLLGIAWGVFCLIILLAFGQGILHLSIKNLVRQGADSLLITAGHVSQNSQGTALNSSIALTEHDFQAIQQLQKVKYISPVYKSQLTVQYQNNRIEHVNVFGVNAQFFKIAHYPLLIGGRYFTNFDQHQKRVIMEKSLAKRLFNTANPLHQGIIFGGNYYQIIGIIDWQDSNPDELLQDIWIPETTFTDIFGNQNLNAIWVQPKALEQIEALKREIIHIIAANHQLSVDDATIVDIQDNQQLIRQQQQYFHTIQVILMLIGIFILLISSLSLVGIISSLVRDDRVEIGLRFALGATPWMIQYNYLFFAVMLAMAATLMGILLALLLIWLINKCHIYLILFNAYLYLKVDTKIVIIVMLISIIISFLSTYWSVKHVKKIMPVVLMSKI